MLEPLQWQQNEGGEITISAFYLFNETIIR